MSSTHAGLGASVVRRPVVALPTRDRAALAAGLVAPFPVSLLLVPLRTHLSHTNAALILVVVVVVVAAPGSRLAGVVAALSAAAWFDFFFTRPYETFDISAGAGIGTAVLLLVVDHVRGELTALLGLSGCRFEYGTLLGQPARLGKDGPSCARTATGTTSAGSCSPRDPGRCGPLLTCS
ncbi:DUF4118 domain-containing protein [Streptomyces sp. NPDC058464]|uniref:DUF4118 domain-containing protein n=1 Tax=Streptomyces sp. NPDC058464 TaxID=3346511 RepID=UPI003664ECA4